MILWAIVGTIANRRQAVTQLQTLQNVTTSEVILAQLLHSDLRRETIAKDCTILNITEASTEYRSLFKRLFLSARS